MNKKILKKSSNSKSRWISFFLFIGTIPIESLFKEPSPSQIHSTRHTHITLQIDGSCKFPCIV